MTRRNCSRSRAVITAACVGRLDRVGVAVADDALGAHGVQNLFEQPRLVDPRGHLDARAGWPSAVVCR